MYCYVPFGVRARRPYRPQLYLVLSLIFLTLSLLKISWFLHSRNIHMLNLPLFFRLSNNFLVIRCTKFCVVYEIKSQVNGSVEAMMVFIWSIFNFLIKVEVSRLTCGVWPGLLDCIKHFVKAWCSVVFLGYFIKSKQK